VISATTIFATAIFAAAIFRTTILAASPTEEKQVSVYSPVATYTVTVLERNGHEYIGLLELLEPLGRVSGESAAGRWTMRFNAVDGVFQAGKTRCRIHGRDFDLSAPFVAESSRGLVPLSSLATLLPRFLGVQVNFHEGARRLFIGDVSVQPAFQFETGPPARLQLSFGVPVNPTISTEPGKVRMVFKHDAVVSPGSQTISFDSKVITQATFAESNGVAELDVAAAVPLMATFANGGKTIVVEAAPTVPAAGTAATPPGGTPPGAAPSGGSPVASPAAYRPLAVVDAAHGGQERGAALSDEVTEKEVTLGFARLLRHELEMRGFGVLMMREGDTTLTPDQRANAANTARAGVYVSLHAVSQGTGARVYTAMLPVEDPSRGTFRAWNAAQTPVLPISRVLAGAVAGALQKRQLSARASSASLRPLNNLLMPAVAVELAPGSKGLPELSSANYQQQAAAAIAEAVASMRDRLGAQP
jgi:N-acetylmuramoyl-L-alanine amidase